MPPNTQIVDPIQAHPPPINASHHRRSSRSTLSPTSRDAPIFAPSTLGRPASVASNHSTQSRGIPIGLPGGKSAPAMAITSSNGSGTFSPHSQTLGWTVGRPPSGSSFSTGQSQSQRDSGSGTGIKGSPLGLGISSGSATNSTSGGLSSMARTISRGFSINKQRASSTSAGSSGGTGGQRAADILKQYGESR
jgi:hypothetical protein